METQNSGGGGSERGLLIKTKFIIKIDVLERLSDSDGPTDGKPRAQKMCVDHKENRYLTESRSRRCADTLLQARKEAPQVLKIPGGSFELRGGRLHSGREELFSSVPVAPLQSTFPHFSRTNNGEKGRVRRSMRSDPAGGGRWQGWKK